MTTRNDPSDYPEPEDATETCAYCGRQTIGDARLRLSMNGDNLVAFKVHCARGCLDASLLDPDWAVHFPLRHRPS